MTTTRARSGSPEPPDPPGPRGTAMPSVGPLGVIEQPAEAAVVAEHGHRGLVPFQPPAPEVEVDGAVSILDPGPQRPAVLGHQAEQLGAREPVPQRPAVIAGHQLLELVKRQVALAPDVAELEAGVVVARVLVVDQPDLPAVVDEVGREQVVVARHGALVPDRE